MGLTEVFNKVDAVLVLALRFTSIECGGGGGKQLTTLGRGIDGKLVINYLQDKKALKLIAEKESRAWHAP